MASSNLSPASERPGRGFNRLSARRVEGSLKPGRHSDGRNLYLIVESSGAKRWAFIYRWKPPGAAGAGKIREMGLGPVSGVSLQAARARAEEMRVLLAQGKDPLAVVRERRVVPTFGELADDFILKRSREVKSDKSVARLRRCLNGYAARLRPMRPADIATHDVMAVLKPIWTAKPETAAVTRGYIEAVLDAAKAQGFREGDNPARGRGHLDTLLPKRPTRSAEHHAAMPYADVPAFLAELARREAAAGLGLRFLILTAARSGEVLGALWSEIDLGQALWTVPAARMKAGREHRVPLSAPALELLQLGAELRSEGNPFVFPGIKAGRPLSNMAFEMLLRRMGRGDFTTHGFRSAFRDWAADRTNYPSEVPEAALAHAAGDATVRAYLRSDHMERRRSLMADWAGFCSAPAAGDPSLGSPSDLL